MKYLLCVPLLSISSVSNDAGATTCSIIYIYIYKESENKIVAKFHVPLRTEVNSHFFFIYYPPSLIEISDFCIRILGF
jgi:hypothetical protein